MNWDTDWLLKLDFEGNAPKIASVKKEKNMTQKYAA